jgi:hypothetical protein
MGVAYSGALERANYISKHAGLYIVNFYHIFWHYCDVKFQSFWLEKEATYKEASLARSRFLKNGLY